MKAQTLAFRRSLGVISRPLIRCVPAVSLLAAGIQMALSEEQPTTGVLQEVIVSAQKRQENLQNVPVSIQAMTGATLEASHAKSFDDYAKALPSLTYQTAGPGWSQLTIRGVTSGGTDWSGPLSTVATYLDEQPVTTNQGTLDVHMFDIARVEVLAGPQGTLYGASSEAGTLRIITNKPDPAAFSAAYAVEGTSVAHGGIGYVVEGFANIPLSPTTAVRLVGWTEHDAGYIDNIPGTRTFPTSGICIANTAPAPAGCVSSPNLARKNINGVTTTGARGTLKVDLEDGWTITPVVMGQRTTSAGFAGSSYNPAVGDLLVTQYYPDSSRDKWVDAALTVEGKIGNLDLVYTGAMLNRNAVTHADYSDYSLVYDAYLSPLMTDNAGALINPSQLTTTTWKYKKQSHEIRLTSPASDPLRIVTGVFFQRQQHDIENRYQIPGLADALVVSGWPNTWWLTEEVRIDRDYAAFGEVSYDITPRLTATAGLRFFRARNSQEGFYGLSAGVDALAGTTTGEAGCFAPGGVNRAPCTNLDKEVEESGNTPRVNLTYHVSPKVMMYATYARGFRPGGINRRGTVPPYMSDTLTNYEIGWKSSGFGNRLRFNGAFFVEDWKNFQFTFTGQNGVGQFANAGQAQVRGIETSIEWAATDALSLNGGIALLQPRLTANYCGLLDANGGPVTDCAAPLAPKGTQLPGASKIKGSVAARYQVTLGGFDGHLQGAFSYIGSTWADLRTYERSVLGQLGAYGVLDLATGIDHGRYSVDLFVTNAADKRAAVSRGAQCAAAVCGPLAVYVVPNQPRTVGLRISQKF